jgi:hypothetical protein
MKEIAINQLKTVDKQGVLNEIRLLASLNSPYLIEYKDTF